MIAPIPTIIFPAGYRSSEKKGGNSCFSTIYPDTSTRLKSPLNAIFRFADESLIPRNRQFYYMDRDAVIILLPLVGQIEVAASNTIAGPFLMPGEIAQLSLKKGQSFLVKNPYRDMSVNFLQIAIAGEGDATINTFGSDTPNEFSPILEGDGLSINFASFENKKHNIYQPLNRSNSAFVFVIQGVFEIEDRLMAGGDGLALWDTNLIHIDSLSDNGKLLILEIK